ncbi:MAG: hypothetical protein IPO37_03410 [Saprospiraceae bacterium]|nr:hypothetical protein [Saprospiraceae bacterium]
MEIQDIKTHRVVVFLLHRMATSLHSNGGTPINTINHTHINTTTLIG